MAYSVAALGGGHGLAATLRALRRQVVDGVVDDLTAIVTVADNGGSSGRLRREFGVLPPGDLRMALAALCGDNDWDITWSRVLQHRFDGEGEIGGHNVGNLMIVALWNLLGDHVQGLDWIASLVQAKGRVLPMALTPMDITADVRGIDPDHPDAVVSVRGQVEVATTPGVIESIALVPPDPPATPEAIAAVLHSDWVFLGPGSWFSSVISHLCVPELRQALEDTKAKRVVVMNLAEQTGETGGFDAGDHLAVLAQHAPQLQIHTVLADRSTEGLAHLEDIAKAMGTRVVVDDIAADDGSPRHDTAKLSKAFGRLFTGF